MKLGKQEFTFIKKKTMTKENLDPFYLDAKNDNYDKQ